MNLTAKEILEIIKECKGSVQSLEIKKGAVSVVFNSTQIEAKNSTSVPPKSEENESVNNLPFDFSSSQASQEESEQQMIDDLKVVDPLKYEELLALGELENGQDDSGS
jgi:hypothetical protein